MSEQNEISMSDFFADAPSGAEDNPASASGSKICKVCQLDLGPLEQNARLQYHFDCSTCEYCKHEIAKEIMMRWVNDIGPRAHSTCHQTAMSAQIAARPVEITQGLLDHLNSWRLTPDLTRTVEENQSRAEAATRKNIVDMNLEETYVLLKMMQAATACISVILSNEKASKDVKIRREQADIEREKRSKDLVADAQETRLSQQAQVEQKRDKKLLSKQTPEGKLLNSFLKMGMNLEQAKAMMATAHKKANENIQ